MAENSPVMQVEIKELRMLREQAITAKVYADRIKSQLERLEKSLKTRLIQVGRQEPGEWTIAVEMEEYQNIDWRLELENRLGTALAGLIVTQTPKKKKAVLRVTPTPIASAGTIVRAEESPHD